ncbi:MAG TPA: hypothetical protein PLA50_09740 [Bacteroidia bacterium]|nr:hypothetical protein [Bacteroidia bacterium]
MKSEIEPVHRLLSELLAHPCQTSAELATWKELAKKLDKAMSDSWEWMTGPEFHEIQHYMIDVKCGKESSQSRQWQRDQMAEFLERFKDREAMPDEV